MNEIIETLKADKKSVEIIVNGRPCAVDKEKISFEEVITLAFGTYDPDPAVAYTVTYSRGNNGNGSGVLTRGSSVMVKKGMVFNVTRTNRS